MSIIKRITGYVPLLLFSAAAILGQDRPEYASKLKSAPPLRVPEEARKSGIGGEIIVRVQLDQDGNVTAVESVTGPGKVCLGVTRPDLMALREAAKDAAKLAKFEPVTNDKRQLKSGVVIFDVPIEPTAPQEDEPTMITGVLGTPGINGPVDAVKLYPVSLPKPGYPPGARAVRVSGPVSVSVVIDETGAAFSARAVSGHPLLRSSAEHAACQARFNPTVVGKATKVRSVITYNFVP